MHARSWSWVMEKHGEAAGCCARDWGRIVGVVSRPCQWSAGCAMARTLPRFEPQRGLRPLSIGTMSEGTFPHHGDTRYQSMPPSSQFCCGVWLVADVLQVRLQVLAVNDRCVSAVSTLRIVPQLPVLEMEFTAGVPRVTTLALTCSQSFPPQVTNKTHT